MRFLAREFRARVTNEVACPNLSDECPTRSLSSRSGKVVHPKGMRPSDVDQSRAVEWQSQDNFVNPVNGRRYHSSVDRDAQILWPGDPMYKGYTGRWGPRMESDHKHAARPALPEFLAALLRRLGADAHPSHVRFLTVWERHVDRSQRLEQREQPRRVPRSQLWWNGLLDQQQCRRFGWRWRSLREERQ
jgi:hypothetical protein